MSAEQSELDNIWEPGSIDSYVPGRQVYEVATKQVVITVLAEHLTTSDRVLEIGSGLGELVRLAPGYERQIQQTDQSVDIVETHKRRNPNSKIERAHAYSLPYSDSSFEKVIGFASFDTIPDIDRAVQEMKRVLTPNGEIIHLLDLQASLNTLLFNLKQSGEKRVPFSDCDKHGRCIGVRLLSASDLTKMKENMPIGTHMLIDMYTADPMEIMEFLIEKDENVLKHISEQGKIASPLGEIIKFNDYFESRSKKALEKAGFTDIKIEKRGANHTTKRTSEYSEVPLHINAVVRDVGLVLGSHDPTIPENHIRTSTNLLVITARKNN